MPRDPYHPPAKQKKGRPRRRSQVPRKLPPTTSEQAPSSGVPAAKPAAPAPPPPSPSRIPQHTHVPAELKRIGIISGGLIVILIVLYVVL